MMSASGSAASPCLGASLVILAWLTWCREGKLFLLTYFAGTIFASSWGPVGIMSVWSRRITESAAFWES